MIFRKLIAGAHPRNWGSARKGLSAGLLATLSCLPAMAATIPSMTVPEGVGVNIHFSKGNEKDLDLIAEAGVKVVRADFTWDEIERYQGVYDWSAYDELAANLAKRGIRPLFILAYSNPLYADTKPTLWQSLWFYHQVMSPNSPRSIAAYTRWATEAAKHFRKYNVMWEIWNEPNIKFWKPAPDVAAYSRLAMSACTAIHQVDPDATVIGPASSGFPWEFLEGFFKAGALTCFDAVTVHPYRSQVPETVLVDYIRMHQLMAKYMPPNRKDPVPLLSGEWGYATVIRGRPLQDQADFVVRMQLLNLLYLVPMSIWYDWKNDGPDRSNYEHNVGIVNEDLSPKPAYTALKTFTTQLSGYRLAQRLKIGNDADYALLFTNAKGENKIAVWTSGREHNVRIAAPPQFSKAKLIDWKGWSTELKAAGGWVPLRITNSPAYIVP
ncbi:MAG: glycoside hydrolase family 5 [Cupriavidus sp.]|nr:MAG: glycoside hydrolase family 5 [Cupriavidus sp.]